MNDITIEELDAIEGGNWIEWAAHAAAHWVCEHVDVTVKVDISGPGFHIEGTVTC